ncbi:MAG: arginine--tRNA ligase [Rhodothermales bacterium]|nr:arginine--tRNA ligase [Rhodothermales bacterium]
MVVKDYLNSAIAKVLGSYEAVPDDFVVELEIPNNPEHGDWSTNAALKLARYLRKAPREIAEEMVARLSDVFSPELITSADVAGAGFINFRVANAYWWQLLGRILELESRYGRGSSGDGKKALVEYVSANPTGPLTVGHGRNAVLGDTIANVLDWSGYDVTREYYFNDAGRQMRVLGESVRSQYLSILNPSRETKTVEGGSGDVVVPEDFPEDGYLGEYIIDIARSIASEHGDTKKAEDAEGFFKDAAEKVIFADIEATLGRIGIRQDEYFNERTLYDTGKIWNVVDGLRKEGLVYDSEGAVWFKTTEFGKEKDTVLVKSSGEPTYRLPDIAYHVDKVERSYDRIVDIFGADHIATVPDVLKGVELLGYDVSGIDVVIYQFVTLVRSGKPVKMSTRKATYETLDDLIDEVGADVVRFFFLMRSANTHLEFDLDLAREASDKNPVFYLQYAHARICSILRKADEVGAGSTVAEPDLGQLVHASEINLIKSLAQFPAVVEDASSSLEPHRIATYLRELAVAFTDFYGNCRIIGEEDGIASARLALARAARIGLANGLSVLGISAPDRM